MSELVPEPNQTAFGLAVAQARLRAGLTLDDLVKRSGSEVSRRTLIEIEQGRANPSTRKVHAIAHATGTPIGDLVRELCAEHEPRPRRRR